jgi:adenosine deaminase
MQKQNSIESFIQDIPKAELHVHIEGAFEPELMFEIARRNNRKLKYMSADDVRKAYTFNDLQGFLDIYYESSGALSNEQDFYDLTMAYFQKIHTQNVLHAEIFFDPQTHTARGVGFSSVIHGIHRALLDAQKSLGISNRLIMCFLRDLDEVSAMETLESALPYKNWITAVGLDSAELGNPPSRFQDVFEMARNEGFLAVAHAGEEGPASYVRDAIDVLKVSRIDHSNHALDDEDLVNTLVERKIPLTVCPLSNVKLQVVDSIEHHPLKIMMDKGLFVTINSDDPAYFGGYINDNYLAVQRALNLTKEDIYTLARNSFLASFLDDDEKHTMLKKLEAYSQQANN